MNATHHRTVLPVEPACAFRFVAEPALAATWNALAADTEVEGELQVGALVRQRGALGETAATVVEHVPELHHAVEGLVDGVRLRVDYHFASVGDGTEVTMSYRLAADGWRRLMLGRLRRRVEDAVAASMASLPSAYAERASLYPAGRCAALAA